MNLTISRNMGASYVKSLAVTILSETAQYCMRIGIDAAEISGALSMWSTGSLRRDSKGYQGRDAVISSICHKQGQGAFRRGGVLDIAKAYIEQYYMMDLDLDKVASICGYSPSYFSRASGSISALTLYSIFSR